MSNSTAQVLMKKGKRGAAAYILADCASGAPQHLGPLLDVLLNPSKAIDEWETIDWCRWLLAGGRTPDEFATVVRSYDKHDKCGLVWIPRVVAYRCRTCGISPCMSICRECFHRGDHSTHDFNMFLSQAGGACDCGDNSVMKEDGFCSNHSKKCPRPGTAPAELMCVAEAMMPRLILRLLQHFRENSFGPQANSDTYRIAVKECEGYVQMLMEINNMGDLMRSAMTRALINPQMYRNLVEPPFPETEYGQYMSHSNTMYEKALDSFPAPDPPEEYRHLPALAPRLQHNTLLEEFIFWTFKYEFPQNVVCFLLNMLPDQDYKEHLTRTFVLHYARIPLVLEAAADPDTLSNRVVHMSVQLFSNEALALRCVQQLHLLHVMVLSLRLMMGKILVQNTLHDPNTNFHYVIDCTKRVMKEHCYWPLVSDFNNVLSHRSVAMVFLRDDALIDMWFEFLSMLQGMNVNVRETGGHIEFEPSSYYAAFSCELEAAAYPMWSVLSHLTCSDHAPLAIRIIAAALTHLQEWLDAVHFTAPTIPRSSAQHASFHFPLHRYVAAFLCAAVRCMGVRTEDVLPPPHQLALLAAHPLRVQSLFYEILAGVWVRNGLQIKGQAMTYIQANFCNSMVDMDIYWLQVCAAHLPADHFIDMCIDMFGVRQWLSMSPLSATQASEQDACVEGLLTFLAILVCSRTNLGNDELTQSRLEVATLLAAGDKTHSQLLELMPERSGNAHTRNFEAVLKELSTYRPPPKGSENLEQGLFVPKPIVWERYYDPLHVLRRAVHRRDFHASTERFTQYVREKQKQSGAAEGITGSSSSSSAPAPSPPGPLWPPLRPATAPPPGAGDPRALCTSGVLHSALLSVLHRGVHRRGAAGGGGAAGGPPDHVLATAVYLLGVAADLAQETADEQTRLMCVATGSESLSPLVSGVPLLAAFSGAALCDNARTVVGSVMPQPSAGTPSTTAHRDHYPAQYHHDSDTEWEPSEGVGGVGGVGGAAALAGPPGAALAAPPGTALALPQPRDLVRTDPHPAHRREAGDGLRHRAIEGGPIDALALQELPPPPALGEGVEGALTLALPEDRMEPDDTPPIQYGRSRPRPPALPPSLSPAPAPAPSTPPMDHDRQDDVNEHSCDPDHSQVQLHAQQDESVPVNESIISLLLKLHSQLSGRLDSFSLEEPAPENEDQPIGDGPHFIGQVLRKLARLDSRCAASIRHVRHSLWPHQRERQAEQRARERREKEERSRRARERQAAVMREFAARQQRFLSGLSASEGASMDWEAEEAPPEPVYCCVICSTTAPPTADDPLGLVVLLQSSSVLAHRRRRSLGRARLALSEPERVRLLMQAEAAAATHHYRLHDDLNHHFDRESWLTSVSVGWEGGVAVASCGHHLHLRCLQAYLRSLAAPHRPHNLHVDRGEFLCPVCRQLANSVLPLGGASPRSRPSPAAAEDIPQQIQDMLDTPHPDPCGSRLWEAMGKAMEDMTATAGAKLKQRYGSSPAAIFTFVSSLLRTNLEGELVQRGGALTTLTTQPQPRYKPRNECIVPLTVVAAMHARVLQAASPSLGLSSTWRALRGPISSQGPQQGPSSAPSAPLVADTRDARPVPLLLKDPLALLMQFILLTPANPPYMDIQHFTCIVRALYALTYYQIVCQFIAGSSASGRAALASPCPPPNPPDSPTTPPVTPPVTPPLRCAARTLLAALAGSDLFTEDGPPQPATPPDQPDLEEMERKLQSLLLPFVRIAALLRHHIYGQELPEIDSADQEFVRLAYYLELVTEGMEWKSWSAAAALPSGAAAAARSWARELGAAAARGQLVVRRILLSLHVEWEQPALLSLPIDYDRLFSYYHERVCQQCGAVPKEASVCLLCGTLVCLKQACCRQHQVAEAVQHAMECGGGTGIFLVVTSTYIIVIRGRRACLWGSLYLDDYDEEDRDLKRGKPLYLSQDRLELLQAQWLAHRFDHTKRTWVWHRDSL